MIQSMSETVYVVEVETLYLGIPWGLEIGQYYYFMQDSASIWDTTWARLMFVEESDSCENSWCNIMLAIEGGGNELIITHAPDGRR